MKAVKTIETITLIVEPSGPRRTAIELGSTSLKVKEARKAGPGAFLHERQR
jgi:hypothetical protein